MMGTPRTPQQEETSSGRKDSTKGTPEPTPVKTSKSRGFFSKGSKSSPKEKKPKSKVVNNNEQEDKGKKGKGKKGK